MQIDRFHTPQGDIENELLTRFRKAAMSPQGLFDYPTGREGLRSLGYPHDFVSSLPDRVAECYCGVGNPFAPGLPSKGEHVLDVGCGAGVDALAAATFVGPDGRVEGLEFSPDMLARAVDNAGLCGAGNLALQRGSAERLPYPDSSFDLLISNGVYNLVQDKPRALAEAFRILRPGGRMQLADQILEAETAPACTLPRLGAPTPAASWAR